MHTSVRSFVRLGLSVALSGGCLFAAAREVHACVSTCTSDAWPNIELLTPEVPIDRGPVILAVRGCETPELGDVALSLEGPGGVVSGKAKQLEQVTSAPKSPSPPFGHDGRIVIGFLPDEPLVEGATYTLTATPTGAAPTSLSFATMAARGPVQVPVVQAEVVEVNVPEYVCCYGAAGCGGGDDPDPYPPPAPTKDTIEPPPSGLSCDVLRTTAAADFHLSFPFVAPAIYTDYRLFDDKNKLLAYFSGRRLTSGFQAIRAVDGESRCFRLEAEDRLSGATTSAQVCTPTAVVEPSVVTRCEEIDREQYSQPGVCPASNAETFAVVCDGATGGAAGSAGSPGTAGSSGGAAGSAGSPGTAGNSGSAAGSAGSPGTAGSSGGEAGNAGSPGTAGSSGGEAGNAGSPGTAGSSGGEAGGGHAQAGASGGTLAGAGGSVAALTTGDDGCDAGGRAGGGQRVASASLAAVALLLGLTIRRRRGN